MAQSTPIKVSTTRRRLVLVVLCLVQFMLVSDDTVVSVALVSIRDDLGFTTTGLTWVVNAYFLTFGGLLLLFGRVADLIGRRRVLLLGVTVFGAASLLCGFAQEPWQLVLGRFAQGTGAAMASPAALALITLLFPSTRERAKALSIWGGIAALGATMGLVISGTLTDLASWRWIFLINIPVAAVALASLPLLVAENRAENKPRLDVPGAILGTGAILCMVYGLIQAAEVGWRDMGTAVPVLSAITLSTVFVLVESRTANPLVPLSMLSSRTRAVSNGMTLLFSAAFFAMAFLLMLHLQTVVGYGPLEAGLAYLPHGAGVLAGMWLSSRAVGRIGLRNTLVVSFLTSAAGLFLLSSVESGDSYASGVLPGLLVTSLGCGVSLPALTLGAVSGTTGENAGLGSAIFGSVQQIGGALGLAVLVAAATRHGEVSTGSSTTPEAATAGYSFALTVAAVVLALGAVLIAFVLREGRRGGEVTPVLHCSGGGGDGAARAGDHRTSAG